MKFSKVMLATAVSLVVQGTAHAGVSAEEAKQLGANLTLFGAEKAGNKDGTIPAYTGGLPVDTKPPGFVPKSGHWADPYANEKPLYSINAQNMAQYADKLTEGMQALLKRYPDFRMDVYPSHRSVNFPKFVLDNSVANATRAKTINGGVSIDGALGGIPFPIVKTGYEAMWNHVTRYTGVGFEHYSRGTYVDTNGKQILASFFHFSFTSPYYQPGMTMEKFKAMGSPYTQSVYNSLGPPRTVGDGTLFVDSIDPVANPRRAWAYSASTRRVRLAPDIAYDTPIAGTGGVKVYDDGELFLGKLDRFEYKLVGKKEIIIPYNSYQATFFAPPEKLLGPKFVNPDVMRWELHRVWVVESKLRPEYRHIYSKRTFYLDEDWTGAGLSEAWDSSGKLFKVHGNGSTQLYDVQRPIAKNQFGYDLSTGLYCIGAESSSPLGFTPKDDQPQSLFSPDALAARSGR